MSWPEIATLVPHSGPMLLLDRLISADADDLVAQLTIGAHSQFFDGAGVGSWVGIEYMAQAIAAHAGYGALLRGEPVKVGFLLGARRYEVKRERFATGSVLHVHVHRAMQGDNGLGAFECRIEEIGPEPLADVASATVTVFQPDNVHDFLQGHSNEGAA
ncbi:MAG: hotdog family protein [Pseudomonadota bacterium]